MDDIGQNYIIGTLFTILVGAMFSVLFYPTFVFGLLALKLIGVSWALSFDPLLAYLGSASLGFLSSSVIACVKILEG